MDAFVLIFLAAFLMYAIPSIIMAARLAQIKKPEKACPPHKWEYRGLVPHQYMICGRPECRMIPGLDAKEEGQQ